MATIPGAVDLLHGSQPDTSGKAWPEPYIILATNDVWGHDIMRVDEDATNAVQLSTKVAFARGCVRVPDDYFGSPTLLIIWSSTKTTGDVVFDFEGRSVGGDNTESMDQAGTEASLTVTDSAGAAVNNRMTVSLALAGLALVAGESLEYSIYRDGVDAADTLAGAACIHEAYFGYSNS